LIRGHLTADRGDSLALIAPAHGGSCWRRPLDRDGLCRSAGRRESGVDCPQPRQLLQRCIRGCRRSYIAPKRCIRGCRRSYVAPKRGIRGCRRSYIAPKRGD
jgi:hypothetical protein